MALSLPPAISTQTSNARRVRRPLRLVASAGEVVESTRACAHCEDLRVVPVGGGDPGNDYGWEWVRCPSCDG